MDIRDKVIVTKVPPDQVSGPKNETMTKKEALAKFESEFVRVSNQYYKDKSE
jgi:hypothetical protein